MRKLLTLSVISDNKAGIIAGLKDLIKELEKSPYHIGNMYAPLNDTNGTVYDFDLINHGSPSVFDK